MDLGVQELFNVLELIFKYSVHLHHLLHLGNVFPVKFLHDKSLGLLAFNSTRAKFPADVELRSPDDHACGPAFPP